MKHIFHLDFPLKCSPSDIYIEDSQTCPVPQMCPIPKTCLITSSSHKHVRFSPQTRLIWFEGKHPPHWRHNITTKYTAVQNMDETILDVGFSIGTIQRNKPVSKDTNPETFWNNFDKIISITKLKLENPKWGPVKMANMVHT